MPNRFRPGHEARPRDQELNGTINIWSIDSERVTRLESEDQTATEELLESRVVECPDMLLPGLTIVGRQTPTPVGYPDLLGIDGDGRLVVFELKRGLLTREAVAQLLDYGSFL